VENFGDDLELKRLDLTWSGQVNGGYSQVYSVAFVASYLKVVDKLLICWLSPDKCHKK